MILARKKNKVCYTIEELKLLSGNYFLEIKLRGIDDVLYDSITRFLSFNVKNSNQKEYGLIAMKCNYDGIK